MRRTLRILSRKYDFDPSMDGITLYLATTTSIGMILGMRVLSHEKTDVATKMIGATACGVLGLLGGALPPIGVYGLYEYYKSEKRRHT